MVVVVVVTDVVISAIGTVTFEVGIGTATVIFGILEIFVMDRLLFDEMLTETGSVETATLTRETQGLGFAVAVLVLHHRPSLETIEIQGIPYRASRSCSACVAIPETAYIHHLRLMMVHPQSAIIRAVVPSEVVVEDVAHI